MVVIVAIGVAIGAFVAYGVYIIVYCSMLMVMSIVAIIITACTTFLLMLNRIGRFCSKMMSKWTTIRDGQ